MKLVGILGGGAERLAANIFPRLPHDRRTGVQFCRLDTSAQPAAELDVLILLPGCRVPDNWGCGLRCAVLLLPDGVVPGAIRADCVVSCGLSGRDTLTLSAIGNREVTLAIQREIVPLSGDVLEQQEICIRRRGGESALDVLAAAGVLLALGIAPTALSV